MRGENVFFSKDFLDVVVKVNTGKTEGVILTPFEKQSVANSNSIAVESIPFRTFNPFMSLTWYCCHFLGGEQNVA